MSSLEVSEAAVVLVWCGKRCRCDKNKRGEILGSLQSDKDARPRLKSSLILSDLKWAFNDGCARQYQHCTLEWSTSPYSSCKFPNDCSSACRWSACAAENTSPKEHASALWWARSTRPTAYPKTPTANTSGGWVCRSKTQNSVRAFPQKPEGPLPVTSRTSKVSQWNRKLLGLLFSVCVCVYEEKTRGCDVIVTQIACHTGVPVSARTLAHLEPSLPVTEWDNAHTPTTCPPHTVRCVCEKGWTCLKRV